MFWSKNTPRNFGTFSRFIATLLIMNNGRFLDISIFFFKDKIFRKENLVFEVFN